MPTDPNPPASQPDTTGAGGASGPAPSGTGSTASTTDTEATAAGGGADPTAPAATQPDTTTGGAAVTSGDADSHSHDPSTTAPDTSGTGAGVGGTADPAYVAPPVAPPVTTTDTSGTSTPVSGTEGAPTASTVSQADTSGTAGNPGTGSTSVPAAPTSVSASRRANGARVSWTAPAPVSGAPTTGFVVTSDTGATHTFPADATSGLIENLTPDRPATFTVYATNKNGAGAKSTASSPVTPFNPNTADDANAPVLSGAPTIGTATVPVAGSAQVTWTAPANDGGADITSYVVTSTPGSLTATVNGSLRQATVTGLTPSTSYTFKVKAVTSVGNSPESAASNSVTPHTVPGAPTIGTATVASSTSATVAFTAPTQTGGATISGYTAVSTPGGLTGTGASSPITVTGLTTGVAYTFKVKATNSVGDSALSAASNSVTPA